MPELPEVETIKIQLRPQLPFAIQKIKTSPVVGSILKRCDFELPGETIEGVERHGKFLIFQFVDRDKTMVSHLGMSGSWRVGAEGLNCKHSHLNLFNPASGQYLSYVDPRRFGNIYLLKKDSFEKYMLRWGRDVSHPHFDRDHFWQCLQRYPQRPIKVTLLDQSLFAGVGNYIAEICARGRVRPTRRAGEVSRTEVKNLFEGLKEIIFENIDRGGNTFRGGYSDAFGEKGQAVSNLLVFYQQTCQLCKKEKVIKIILASRGTYFCPRCQK